jgi:outer membrane protein assembly factor BamB
VTTAVSAAGKAPLKVGIYGDGDPADDNGEQSWVIYCLDKSTGEILRQRVVAFLGSQGVFVYDLDGKLLWSKDLGAFDIGPVGYGLQWGTASSPILFEDKLVLQCDQKQGGFLLLLDARDGKELWRLKFPGDIPVPTRIFSNGLIYVTNAHSGPTPLFAIKPDAHRDISPQGTATSSEGLAWYEPHNGAYMQTPPVLDGLIYGWSDRGVLKVFDARTGELKYSQHLGAGTTRFSASPIAVDGKILFTSEEGEVFVVKAGPQFELLSKNLMGETSMASSAFSEDTIFYRTQGHVVAIKGN